MARTSISQWYNGKQFYNFSSPVYNQKSGYFTQLVWKSTNKIGCGLAMNDENKAISVVYYYPRGNVIGQFNENVLKEIS